MLNVVWASAQFSGSGSGTSTDPYRIFNATQLSQLRNFLNQEGVYFKLQNDIDLTDWLAENYPGQGWQPVGSSTEPFKGILDGNNKTISGFSITRTSMDYVGLFGYVTGATIKDLTLKGNISGKAYVGSLMGYGSATVTNYTFEGNVTGTSNYTGGVGGYQTTASTNLTVKATVNGTSYTGGFYGYGAGITTATFTGEVTGTGSDVGGLEGSASGTFSSCTVNGPVKSTSSSAQYVGGLIGYARATVTANNCKQEGIVQGKSYTGGLAGYTSSNITISSNTHRGNIIGTTNTGGAIGGGKTVNLTSCYIEGNIVGTTSIGGICGVINQTNNSNINGCNYWGDISGTSQLGGIIGKAEKSEEGTSVDFTSTTTAGTRGAVNGKAMESNSACFFKSEPAFRSSPISPSSRECFDGCSFIATSADIGDWTVSTTRNVYYWGNGSSHLYNVPITVRNNILLEDSYSYKIDIVNCSATGNINGSSSHIGGIIGQDLLGGGVYSATTSNTIYYYKDGATTLSSVTLKKYNFSYFYTNIRESYFSGSLKGTNYVGGIAGTKEGGQLSNCYAAGFIVGSQYVGGIAGSLTKNSLNTYENSMNANVSACTTITGTSNVGRIYGYTDGNFTIAALGTNSENRSMASTQVVVNGVTQTIMDNLQHGTAVGVSLLRLKSNYVAWGWDWNNCWTILDTESFPYKTWQSAPPTFSGKLTSGATTISGNSVDGGTVYLSTSSGKAYTATCSGNTWSKTVTALHAGETVTAYAAGANKEKSYFTTTTVDFSGSGTEADPYQIASAEDLQGLYKGGYYKIMNNIDLTSWINQYSSTKGWLPVGYDGAAVYIDGDNHTITGLWTNTTDTYTGLFSKLKDGYIKNLNVEVASGKKVKGGQYTGALIAYATNFKLMNCSVNGNVEGTTYVGGFAGYISGSSSNPNLSDMTYEGTLSSATASAKIGGIAGYGSSSRLYHTYSTVQITSTGNSSLIGGLVGHLYGRSASQCTANVNINASGTGNKVGGLFGTAQGTTSNATTISESYSTGTIKATGSDSWTGGIAGALTTNAQLSDSYSTATVTGTQYTAGLVGQASAASKINRCYATGNLTGVYFGAGIVGYLNGANTEITNCVALNNILTYTDQSAWASRVIGGFDEASGDPDGSNLALATMQVSLNNIPVTKYDDLVEGIAKSEAEMKQAATYEAKGWDFGNVWTMAENGYPLLKWQIPEPTLATGISLYNTILSFTVIGQTATLIAAVMPEDATDKTVTWTSSNTNVATVDNNGLVTAVAAGSATITATTNDGTNLSASCEVTVSISTEKKGDTNGDNEVSVTDYLAIANHILGINVENFNASAADVNGDNDVSVVDYVGVANIILYGNYTGPSANAVKGLHIEQSSAWMEAIGTEDGNMNLLLHEMKPFAAFQMDINLPEGVEIVDAKMSKKSLTRNLGISKLEDGTWRLLYGTLENKAVALDGDYLLTLELASGGAHSGTVSIENIVLVDNHASATKLNDVYVGLPTGIRAIEGGSLINIDGYDLAGRKIANSNLKKGIYIVNGKKVLVK